MDNIPHLQTLRRYLTNFAMVVKMARGKRSIWRCRSFRWLQRGWFHWVDPSFGSNLYWPAGCRKVALLSHIVRWRMKITPRLRKNMDGWRILPILSGRMQRASCFSMLPEVPNLWNVHFVILKHKMKRGGQREHNLWPLQTLKLSPK